MRTWNHTCVTRLDRPVICAMRSRSCPSGLESIWKLACRICSCSSVNVVRTRFDLFFDAAVSTIQNQANRQVISHQIRPQSAPCNAVYIAVWWCSVGRSARQWTVVACTCHRRNRRDDTSIDVHDAPSPWPRSLAHIEHSAHRTHCNVLICIAYSQSYECTSHNNDHSMSARASQSIWAHPADICRTCCT